MKKHAKHAIHNNSALAHREDAVVRQARKAQVLGVYQSAKGPLTDRQVMEKLGFVDPNTVRPIITKLIDKRALKEIGDTICKVTKHKCRLVALVDYKECQQRLF